MNFFGHAWVAAWFSGNEPFILGAMLPDLANILRAPPPSSRHAELSAGIRMHHETDRVFHDAEAFRALEDLARLELGQAGVPKGARRALAHVGVELLIDAALAADSPAWMGYALALQFGSTEACGAHLDWADATTRPRFSGLCERLAETASTRSDTRRIAQRLVAALSGRPRLELSAEHVHLVEPWLATCRSQVAARLPDLLAELARELGAPTAPSVPPPMPSVSLRPAPSAGSPAPAPR